MKKAVSTTLTAGVLAVSMLLTPFSALAAGGPIDLDAERAIPSAPQLGFADTEDTEYVEGAVLHYVDFSKVNSLEEIGYYVAPNATNANTTMELTDDGLYVKATDQKVNITPFGASVPRNIKDYTLEMTVKFDNPNGKYLVFNPAESATGTGAVNGDIALRPVGQKDENWVNQRLWFHDKGQLMNDSSADDAAAIKQAVANGEFVTFSISVRNLSVVGVKVSGAGKTIYLQGNTAKGVLGSNWGLTVGNGNDELHLKSVKMIAGYNLDAEQKWPAGYVENENLLSVPSSALVGRGPIDLDAERAIPSAPQLGFADTEDTEYVEGAVLHYVDFSKVKSLEEIGYYVAPNATNANTTMELTDDGLYCRTENRQKMLNGWRKSLWMRTPSATPIPHTLIH